MKSYIIVQVQTDLPIQFKYKINVPNIGSIVYYT